MVYGEDPRNLPTSPRASSDFSKAGCRMITKKARIMHADVIPEAHEIDHRASRWVTGALAPSLSFPGNPPFSLHSHGITGGELGSHWPGEPHAGCVSHLFCCFLYSVPWDPEARSGALTYTAGVSRLLSAAAVGWLLSKSLCASPIGEFYNWGLRDPWLPTPETQALGA